MLINNGQRIIPVKDLFANLDLTYSGKIEHRSEDEDMDTANEDELNNTVIEKTEPNAAKSNV